jgi:hypothetical protein
VLLVCRSGNLGDDLGDICCRICSLDVLLRDGDFALFVDHEGGTNHAAVVFTNMYICAQQQLHFPAAIQGLEGNELAIDRQREGCLKLWQGEGVDEYQALNEGASDGCFEVVPPCCDLTVGDVEDTHDWHRKLGTVLTAQHIGTFMHHDTVVADLPMHDEINTVEPRQELGNELSDGFSALYRGRRRDIAVHRVFGEAAGDFVGIWLGPHRTKSGDYFVG